MKTGISSYAFTWAIGVPGYLPESRMTVYELIEIAKKMQVESLQIADNMPLHLFDNGELLEIKKKADAVNIQIEPGTKRLDEHNLDQYLKITHLFQNPFLRIIIDDGDYKPDIETIVGILNNMMPVFEHHGTILAIENHDRFLAKELVHIIDTVQSNRLGICLDSVNSMGAGEGIKEVTELLGPYTINLHVKEFTAIRANHKMGFTIEGRPLGKGLLPLEWMLNTINPKCFSATLEQWTPPEPELLETIRKERQWADESIIRLKASVESFYTKI